MAYRMHLALARALTAALNSYRANSGPEMMLTPTRPLPRFTQPTMGIRTSDDPRLIEEFVTNTADLVDNSWRHERIEHAGHWVQLDQPEAVSSLLIGYLPRDVAYAVHQRSPSPVRAHTCNGAHVP